MKNLKLKGINPEIFYTENEISEIGREEIEFLKNRCLQNSRQKIRICTHKGPQDRLHEMLIVHTKNAYVTPHKHINKSESVHVIEGIVDVVIFNEAGEIEDLIKMGDYASGRVFYYRMEKDCYHTFIIKSDFLVFHEAVNGPFNKSDTIFSEWAPSEADAEKRSKYIDNLQYRIKEFEMKTEQETYEPHNQNFSQ